VSAGPAGTGRRSRDLLQNWHRACRFPRDSWIEDDVLAICFRPPEEDRHASSRGGSAAIPARFAALVEGGDALAEARRGEAGAVQRLKLGLEGRVKLSLCATQALQ
jgi:hypothetical protein